MEGTIIQILELLEATPADYFNLGVGLVVVMYIRSLALRLKVMENKYHALDKANVRLWDRLYPSEVSDHHTGDYNIPPKRG